LTRSQPSCRDGEASLFLPDAHGVRPSQTEAGALATDPDGPLVRLQSTATARPDDGLGASFLGWTCLGARCLENVAAKGRV
jgi:hypothetical protein